ncbi:MAG: ribonucleoside-diphosphate reductase subunit alpha [Aestuariibacter sp.]|nr:ribonucleoside-diphosphate reductase subunit alpha [Aestuariibacter sp.]|tara:strand:- start:25471 stop:27627 length:2157 start_codon:yes stop_codon:yes gene_type:complete
MLVLKRDGSKEPFDLAKIKQVIGWASQGLEVNPLQLESKISAIFNDGVETDAIQENLTYAALSMTTAEEPHWSYVAGRLLMMRHWKETDETRQGQGFAKFVRTQVEKGLYSTAILDNYTDDELNTAGRLLAPERDLDYDFAGADKLIKGYLVKNETPQIAYLMCALLINSAAKEKSFDFVQDLYDGLSLRRLSLATPFLRNLRRPEGNLSSCFIISMNDDLDSIFDNVKNFARISKEGGGCGVLLSNIRASGSWVRGRKDTSKGVIPVAKLFNDTATYVDQGGTRQGAVTLALDVWHADIHAFLEMQTEVGDHRAKAFDVFPQVVMPDHFWNVDKENGDWHLFDPYELRTKLGINLVDCYGDEFVSRYQEAVKAYENGQLEIVHVVKAREILKDIIKLHVESGLPYLFNKCTVNRLNPNKHEGIIPCGNLCVESYSNVLADEEAHTCNLISVNLANQPDFFALEVSCRTAVRALDYAIDLTTTPIRESNVHNNKYRTIGVGAMGLNDFLAARNTNYEAGMDLINELFEEFAYACISESIKLSSELAPFTAFKGSMWDTGERIEEFAKHSSDPARWEALQVDINKHGIRNSQIMAIAPNTSSSVIHGCVASILPVWSALFYDESNNRAVPIVPPYLQENPMGYKPYKHYSKMTMNDIVSTVQRWIDTGISYEMTFDLNNQSEDAFYRYQALRDAWEKGIKCIYYTRNVDLDSSCTACAN